MVIGGMGGWPNLDIELFANCLRLSGEGFEKTDSNCLLSMLAFDTGSEWVWPSEFRGAIPMFSVQYNIVIKCKEGKYDDDLMLCYFYIIIYISIYWISVSWLTLFSSDTWVPLNI